MAASNDRNPYRQSPRCSPLVDQLQQPMPPMRLAVPEILNPSRLWQWLVVRRGYSAQLALKFINPIFEGINFGYTDVECI